MAFSDPVFHVLRCIVGGVAQDANRSVRWLTGRAVVADNPTDDAIDLDLTDVEDQIDTVESDYDALVLAVGGASETGLYEDQIAAIDADVTAAEAQAATNTATIASHASTISSNASYLSGLLAAIAALVSDIATNAADIATNAAGIATNTADIATNAAAIATNVTDIATNASDISDLQADPPTPTSITRWAYPSGRFTTLGQTSFDSDSSWASHAEPNYTPLAYTTVLPNEVIGLSGGGGGRSWCQLVQIPEGVDQVTITAYCNTSGSATAAFNGRDLSGNLGTAVTGVTVSGGSATDPAEITVATNKAISDLAWVAGSLCYWYFEITSTTVEVDAVAIKFEFSSSS